MKEHLLTKKELEILDLIKKAKSRKQISDACGISINTVNSHIRNLHFKTKTNSMPELMIWENNLK